MLHNLWASRSGYVQPRKGLSVGMLAVSAAVILCILSAPPSASGTPGEEGKYYCCYLIGPGQETWCCNPEAYCVMGGNVWNYRDHVEKDQHGECFWLEDSCSCF